MLLRIFSRSGRARQICGDRSVLAAGNTHISLRPSVAFLSRIRSSNHRVAPALLGSLTSYSHRRPYYCNGWRFPCPLVSVRLKAAKEQSRTGPFWRLGVCGGENAHEYQFCGPSPHSLSPRPAARDLARPPPPLDRGSAWTTQHTRTECTAQYPSPCRTHDG